MVKAKREVLKDPVLQKIVEVIVKEIDPDKIILFGSRARGDYDEYSDYDILVLKDGIRPEERRRMATRLEVALFRAGVLRYANVDIIVKDTTSFERTAGSRYKVSYWIKREGRLLYEKVGGGERVA